MIERDLLWLAPAVGAGSIPGINDLAPEAALYEPLGHQHRSLNVGRHLGELLQPDASADADGSLQHCDDLVPAAWRHPNGDFSQNLPGGFLIPGPHRGVKGQESPQFGGHRCGRNEGHRCVAFPQLARVA